MKHDDILRFGLEMQRYAAAQKRVLSASVRLLLILRQAPDGRAVAALLKLLQPLYSDYAVIEASTRRVYD